MGEGVQVKRSVEVAEGRGARVRRLFPTRSFDSLDPFVLFDEFYVEKPAGFPAHSHAGFEFITYMIEGSMVHEDSMGNREEIPAGGVQHAVTGSGINHSELPGGEGLNHGIQLWINLPRSRKNERPSYTMLQPHKLRRESFEWGSATFIVDEHMLTLSTPVDYLDVRIQKGKVYKGTVNAGYSSLIYVLWGEMEVGEATVKPHEAAVLQPGMSLRARMLADTRFVYLSGKPLGEPIRVRGSRVE